jgi:hypothetical protein
VSAVEYEPAQLVAQPLVVEHEIADLMGEPGALPLALQAAGRFRLLGRFRRLHGSDGVRGRPEFVGRHVPDRSGLRGSVCGMSRCPLQLPGRRVRMAGRGTGLCPRDLAPRPGTPEVDRPTGTVVLGPDPFEVRQHVLGAVSCPQREETVVVVPERPAAPYGDEPRIADLGEDHQPRVEPSWTG